jgi:hypothetical protein
MSSANRRGEAKTIDEKLVGTIQSKFASADVICTV